MSERRFPVGMLIMVPIILGLGVYAFTGQHPAVNPEATVTPDGAATPGPGADPTSAPDDTLATAFARSETRAALGGPQDATQTPQPTSTPARLAQHGAFHDGAWVRINAGAGDCLNARSQPSMSAEYNVVNVCLPDGYEGYLSGTSVQQDGHWWWMLAGSGWVAEDYLAYVRDVSLQDALAPQLAGLGRIAFFRGSDIWVMNADGSEQRLVKAGDKNAYPYNLAWSPDGTRLSYGTTHYNDGPAGGTTTMDMHVIDLAGTETLLVNGVMGGTWSPDGTRIGVVQGAPPEGVGGVWFGAPGWVDVATGAVHLVATQGTYQQDPPAWNHDGTRLLLTDERYDGNASRRSIRIVDVDGEEIARIDQPENVYYSRPRWSPDGARIAFHVSDSGRPRIAVYDLAAHQIVAEAAVPDRNPDIGGKCGSADMWLVAWSRDGRHVLYSYGDGLAGTNGVWVWDVARGEQHLVPALNAGPPAAGPDGFFAFSASGYSEGFIFAGATGGGMPMLITNGHTPIWSP